MHNSPSAERALAVAVAPVTVLAVTVLAVTVLAVTVLASTGPTVTGSPNAPPPGGNGLPRESNACFDENGSG
jgi:hypothetical protein